MNEKIFMGEGDIPKDLKFMRKGELFDFTADGIRKREYSKVKQAIEVFKSTYSGLDSFDVAENNNNNLVLVFDESIKFDVMNLIFINTMTNSGLHEEAKILSNYL